MGWFGTVDWGRMLLPDTPLVEIFVRGTAVYLGLFVLLRLILRRQAGGLSVTDVLLVVLLADAAQNAMAGEYTSITDGLFLVTVILGWSYFLDYLGYQFPTIGRFIHPPSLPLVKNGRLLRHNMRKELVTEEELMSQIRQQGVESLEQVKAAYMEGDGTVTVLTKRDNGG